MATAREWELGRLRAMTLAEKLRVAEALWRDAWALTEAGVVRRDGGQGVHGDAPTCPQHRPHRKP